MQRDEILVILTGFLRDVIGEDWDDEIEVDDETSFADDLELESIEFVELAEKVQARFEGIDFAGWLSSLELDQILGLTVGQVVDQIAAHVA
jgi:acyl carrier protein